ncbi:unnamed protein product [Lota lota]
MQDSGAVALTQLPECTMGDAGGEVVVVVVVVRQSAHFQLPDVRAASQGEHGESGRFCPFLPQGSTAYREVLARHVCSRKHSAAS